MTMKGWRLKELRLARLSTLQNAKLETCQTIDRWGGHQAEKVNRHPALPGYGATTAQACCNGPRGLVHTAPRPLTAAMMNVMTNTSPTDALGTGESRFVTILPASCMGKQTRLNCPAQAVQHDTAPLAALELRAPRCRTNTSTDGIAWVLWTPESGMEGETGR